MFAHIAQFYLSRLQDALAYRDNDAIAYYATQYGAYREYGVYND